MSLAVAEEARCTSTRRDIRVLFVLDEARPGQRFFPLDKLRSYLTPTKVAWVLQCPCANCKRNYAAFRRNKSPTEFIDRIVGPENDPDANLNPSKTAFALFALLIYIEHPLLIIGFIMRECCDVFLERRSPASFSTEQLRAYCSEFANREGNEEFRRFASEFTQFLPQFAIPRMDSGVYSVYGADTILPFVNERKIGIQGPDGTIRQEGANGRVCAFEIYEEYRNFPHAKECTRFARKELESTVELAFHLENRNLDVAKTLQDPHIVRMIKAYKHGNTFNLIFPLAKTNLDHLLRDPALDCSDSVQGPVESRSAWKQVLGIATALGNIGGPKGTDSIFGHNTQQQFQGVHFDLKPANILIDDDNNWVISDFGQATFKSTSESSSRVVNQGGTDAYAPPEIDNLDAQFSRRYDIWSLGCIILEVTAFVVLGYDGLRGCEQWQGLDQVRCTTAPWNRRQDNRFFCQESYQGEYKVKKEIADFMEFLRTAEFLQLPQKSQVFLDSILDLVKKMLEPKAEDRIEIGEVIRLLQSAIEESGDDAQPLGMVAVPGERSIGEPDLGRVHLWHWRYNQWKQASLRVFEDAQSNLRTCTVANNTSPSEDHLMRARDKLIPRYAFRERFTPYTSEKAIYFSDISPEGSQEYPGLIFSFSEAQDALLVQAKLTGQNIEASFPLENVKYQRNISIGNRFSHFAHRHKGKEEDCTDFGTGRVQLWSEIVDKERGKLRQNSLLSAQVESARPVRMQPHQQPGYREVPPRRLVIFIHKSRTIITIPMDRNWHEGKQDGGHSKVIRFSPTTPARDPSFVASILRAPHPEKESSFPGIPLCSRLLRRMEHENRFECDSVDLTFRNEEQRKMFSKTYQDMKQEWRQETRAVERQPGYTPVPPPLDREPLTPKPKPESRSLSWNLFRLQTSITQGSSSSKAELFQPQPHRGGSRGGSRVPRKSDTTSQTTSQTTSRDSRDR